MASHSSTTTVDRETEQSGTDVAPRDSSASELAMGETGTSPVAGGFFGRMVYNTSYAVSFGVTFPIMMIVRVVPRENALVHGLVDGARAARDRAYDGHAGMADDLLEGHVDDPHASENGEAQGDDEADRSTRRRPRTKREGTRKTARASTRKKG